jgi:hypothetical protein
MESASDWVEWHRDYADPDSALSHRLDTVVARTRGLLDTRAAGPIRLISACSGQGRDVVGALSGHPRASDVSGRLVEANPENSAVAGQGLSAAGLTRIDSICADASITDAYAGVAPADVVLMCGIFGNISDADIHRTVALAPMLCAPGAHVVWTRHRRAPDLTVAIRRWFASSGFEEASFDSPGPGQWAVGVHRLVGPPAPLRKGVRLFTFIP